MESTRTGSASWAFPAGGIVAASVAYNYTAQTRPAFVAPVYLAHDLAIKGGRGSWRVHAFVCGGRERRSIRPRAQNVAIYQAWVAAKKPAELHVYAKGGHGFGMNKQNLPCDTWVCDYVSWGGGPP